MVGDTGQFSVRTDFACWLPDAEVLPVALFNKYGCKPCNHRSFFMQDGCSPGDIYHIAWLSSGSFGKKRYQYFSCLSERLPMNRINVCRLKWHQNVVKMWLNISFSIHSTHPFLIHTIKLFILLCYEHDKYEHNTTTRRICCGSALHCMWACRCQLHRTAEP